MWRIRFVRVCGLCVNSCMVLPTLWIKIAESNASQMWMWMWTTWEGHWNADSNSVNPGWVLSHLISNISQVRYYKGSRTSGWGARTLRTYCLHFCPFPVFQTTEILKLLCVLELAGGLFNKKLLDPIQKFWFCRVLRSAQNIQF